MKTNIEIFNKRIDDEENRIEDSKAKKICKSPNESKQSPAQAQPSQTGPKYDEQS